MKKTLAAILILTIICSTIFAVKADVAGGQPVQPEAPVQSAKPGAYANRELMAARLKQLGMFKGVGEDAGGNTVFDLDRAPTREEALVMLIRALGKEGQALAHPKTHPFTDVPQWADGYVSYAYGAGLTSGVSETLFGAGAPVSAEMFLTFMLRALGYADGKDAELTEGDFYWSSPWAMAAWCEILPPGVDGANFTRGDVAAITCAAFYANVKGTQTALYERLISEGAFTGRQFQKAFPDDLFSICKTILQMYSKISAIEEYVDTYNNRYHKSFRYVVDMTENEKMYTVDFITGSVMVMIGKDNEILDMICSSYLEKNDFDKENLDCRSGETYHDYMLEPDNPYYNYFSRSSVDAFKQFYGGLYGFGKMAALAKIRDGTLKYTPPGYEATLSMVVPTETESGFAYDIRLIETDICTIAAWSMGGMMHGPYGCLYLIYKPGSAVGDGECIPLPLPAWNNWEMPSTVGELTVSEDGRTLYYSFYFENALSYDGETVFRKAGTYNYTVDLTTGKTELVIS